MKGNNANNRLNSPFTFILKEGRGIHRNFFDYNLLLLQTSCSEFMGNGIREYTRKNPFFVRDLVDHLSNFPPLEDELEEEFLFNEEEELQI